MKLHDLESLLIVGSDLVALAKSAKAAGFKVYAVDYFGDYDLVKICDGCCSVIRQRAGKSCGKIMERFNPENFVKLAKKILEKASADALLLSSGLDDSFDVLEELNELVPILGNNPEVFRRVRDKYEFFRELKRLNLACPEMAIVEDIRDARKVAKDIGYPIVVKPSMGFAGAGIRKARNFKELKKGYEVASKVAAEVVVQEYVDGIHASISLLSSGNEAQVLTVNEQLLGMQIVGQLEPFGFCGNIVPLDVSSETFRKCHEIAKKVALHFRLLGSNGIDFVLSGEGKPYIIEVNPRFQATIECVERVLHLNLVKKHVNACLNCYLPNISRGNDKHYVRLILYSKNRVRVGDLTGLEWVRDIPFPGVIVEEGEPLCSVIAEARDKKYALKGALDKAELIYRSMVEPV